MHTKIYCLLPLQEKFPRLCLHIETVMERMSSMQSEHEFCGGLRWAPRRWGFAADDELIALVEKDIFHYARKNLALLNVYIKVVQMCLYRVTQKIAGLGWVDLKSGEFPRLVGGYHS